MERVGLGYVHEIHFTREVGGNAGYKNKNYKWKIADITGKNFFHGYSLVSKKDFYCQLKIDFNSGSFSISGKEL